MALDNMVINHIARLEAQDAGGPVVAFFDLDRTVIQGYSALSLLLEYLRQGNSGVRRFAFKVLANIDPRGGGRRSMTSYRRPAGLLAGMEDEAMKQLGEDAFARSLEASIYREARQIMRRHRELGHKVVIVSAATSYQVEPVASDDPSEVARRWR